MIAYASRTGTRRNLDAMRRSGWRLIVSAGAPERGWRSEGFRYAIDNGAWTAHTSGIPWDPGRFRALVELLGGTADWIAAPDIVLGGHASLRLSETWLAELTDINSVLIPVQDGMIASDLRGLVSDRIGLFVGGSTPKRGPGGWKEQSTQEIWGPLARETGCYLHVGRIGSQRKIKLCAMAGADSFDSSGPSRYAEVIPILDEALKMTNLTLPQWDRRRMYCSSCGFHPSSCACGWPVGKK